MRLHSGETLAEMASCTGKPSAAPSMAKEMPVFPVDASSSVLPGASRLRILASWTMAAAARSIALPLGWSTQLCRAA